MLQTLFKKMSQEKPHNSRMSVDAGHFVFHYMIEDDVCYLTLTEAKYPKKLAYQYLDELHSEFMNLFRTQIQSAVRPYAFVKFGEPAHLSCWLIPSSTREALPVSQGGRIREFFAGSTSRCMKTPFQSTEP